MAFASIPDVLTVIRTGGMIVLVDDEDRENEGDLVMAAQFADARSIAFMATKGCGLICLPMDGSMLDRLGLPLMSRDHRSRLGTAFTLSIEAREGVATGISAADRARTIQAAVADQAGPQDIVVPGHIFPLRARDGGVLVRAGHSEAAVDLSRLAGLKPAGVICEIMRSDGVMARLGGDLEAFSQDHGLLLASIADVIAYREARESLVELVADGRIEGPWPLRAYVYRNTVSGDHHIALVTGERLVPGASCPDPVLVRVQKQSSLVDLLGGATGLIDPRQHLAQISEAGDGILLMIHDTGGQDLPGQLVAAGGNDHRSLPRGPFMDPRDYGIGAQILHQLGVRRMRLITTSDRHISALSGHGLEVVERVRPLAGVPTTGT